MNQYELPPNVDSLNIPDDEGVLSTESTEQPPDSGAESPTEAEKRSITIELDPDDPYKSLQRLTQQDPKVANTIRSYIGIKAKADWEPRVQAAELRAAGLERELAKARVNAIPENERNQRIAQDAEFANQYRQANEQVDYNAQAEQIRIGQEINSILSTAVDRGLSPTKAEQFFKDLSEGKYDGQDIQSSLGKFREDVWDAVIEVGRERTQPEQQTQQESPQPQQQSQQQPQQQRRDSASPDMSTSAGGTVTSGTRYSINQVRNMTPDELLTAFPNDGDYERAIAEGRIEGVSSESIAVARGQFNG